MAEVTPLGRRALEKGIVELRVKRQGIIQRLDFAVRRFPAGKGAEHVALCTEKIVDVSELERVAAETGLPVFSANGKVFPKGTGSSDFIGF